MYKIGIKFAKYTHNKPHTLHTLPKIISINLAITQLKYSHISKFSSISQYPLFIVDIHALDMARLLEGLQVLTHITLF